MNENNGFRVGKKLTVAQKLIIIMTLIMLSINGVAMFVINDIMEKTMIDNEHKYLSEITKNISSTVSKTIYEYITVCDVITKNTTIIDFLKESGPDTPMQTHEKRNAVVNELSSIVDGFSGTILNLGILDMDQDSYLTDRNEDPDENYSFKESPYYETVVTLEPVITEPYVDLITGELVITVGFPVLSDGQPIGAVALDLPLSFVSELVTENSYGNTGRTLVLDSSNTILAYVDSYYINKNYKDLNAVSDDLDFELLNPSGELFEYTFNDVNRMGIVSTIDALDWKVLTAMDYDEFDTVSPIISFLLIGSSALTLVICSFLITGKVSEELLELHHRDSLTGLYNRAGFSQEIDALLNQTPQSLGLISVNINGLKHTNSSFGYVEGDKLIKHSVKQLRDYFNYNFYRLSGDEFVGVAPNVEKDVFEQEMNSIHELIKQNDNYSFAIGHAFKNGRCDFDSLLTEAEALMYINKQQYYHVNKSSFSNINSRILSDLLSFLENDEFMIYLQPQVRLADSSLYGAEALIRRFDKTNQKMVFPDQFIPLYEQNSIIRHVDIFVIETVCKLLNSWGSNGQAIPISVNLSRVTLQEHGIVDTIVDICDKHSVPHELLVIEVTERVGLIENNVASSLIVQFKENGFNISLDDFGCAYSNIVTLAQIEVDEVKIDKSLVDDLTTNKKNNILVKNVLTMCRELENTSTLAEGIEDESQAKLLHDLGCHLGQGYYFSRPIPVNEFIDKYII